jgi:hypothetical protein
MFTIVTRKSWHEHRDRLILIFVLRFPKPAKYSVLKRVRGGADKVLLELRIQEISFAERTYSRLKLFDWEYKPEGVQTHTVALKGFVVGPRQGVGRE